MPGTYQLTRAICEGLDSIELVESDSDTAWTKAIATTLCEIGKRFGFQVGASTVDEAKRDWGEWLYDVTWLEYQDRRVISAPLVAECEWGNLEGVKDDFDKLLLARAGVRLMIFDGNHRHGSEWIAEQLAMRVRSFNGSIAGDAWLLAAWVRLGPQAKESDQKDWEFRYYTVGGKPSLFSNSDKIYIFTLSSGGPIKTSRERTNCLKRLGLGSEQPGGPWDGNLSGNVLNRPMDSFSKRGI